MRILFFFMLAWAATLSSCVSHDAAAMARVESHKQYSDSLDLSVRDEVKSYICTQIECPAHFTVDEFKTNGQKIAAIHVSVHYYF